MKILLSLLGMMVLSLCASVESAEAQIYPYSYPWCGSFGSGGAGGGGYSGGENCGFTTYAQCLESVKPFGMCRNNPLYRPSSATEAQSAPRRKHRSNVSD
jgi:hypothetical protein